MRKLNIRTLIGGNSGALTLLLLMSTLAFAQWPSFHGNSCNTGVYPGAEGRSGAWSSLWEFPTQSSVTSSPALADIDNDGLLEVVIGLRNEGLFAFNGGDGSVVWSYAITNSENTSSPLITDLDSDGKPEVVFATDDSLLALQGESGELLWSTPIDFSGFGTSPCTGDLDGDGLPEVIYTSPTETMAFSGETGALLWIADEYCVIFDYGSPAVGDIDLNGTDEVLTYSLIDSIGFFTAFSGIDGSLVWSTPIPEPTMLVTVPTPAFADLDMDGYPEIISCAGDGVLIVMNASDGTVKWLIDFPATEIFSSPCVADLDGNDSLDIVVGLYGSAQLKAYTCTGDLIWSISTPSMPLATPVIADIDGDQDLEVIQPLLSGLINIYNAETGILESQYFCGANPILSSPAIGDLDGDGFYDIVFGSHGSKVSALSTTPQGIDPQSGINPIHLSVYPNPFNQTSTISYEVAQACLVSVDIFDLSGRIVYPILNSEEPAGQHSVEWSGTNQAGEDVSPGLYLCRIQTGSVVETTGLCLIR